jgi:hypothetical protein
MPGSGVDLSWHSWKQRVAG